MVASLPSLPIPDPHMCPSSTEEKYGRGVCIIPVDFSDGFEIYPQIAEKLQDLDIGVLGEGTVSLGIDRLCGWYTSCSWYRI